MDCLARDSMVVYALKDPRTGKTRYVGKTVGDVAHRLSVHLSPSHLKHKTKKNSWLKQLVKLGLKPIVAILDVADDEEELVLKECQWIDCFRLCGVELLNMTAGGEGAPGSVRSEEWKRMMSRLHKGKEISQEHRQILSLVHRGSKRPPRDETYSRNASLAHGGRLFKDESGRVWVSTGQAARELGLRASSVWSVLNGRMKQTGGHVFVYVEP